MIDMKWVYETPKEIVEAPNQKYLLFSRVRINATKGNNNNIIMEMKSDCFDVTEGRIGVRVGTNKPQTRTLDRDQWNRVYSMALERGCTLLETEKLEKIKIRAGGDLKGEDGKDYLPIQELSVKNIVQRLMNFAHKMFSESYEKEIENISPTRLKAGEDVLNELATTYETLSVAAFNNLLQKFYSIIPRRIDNLQKKMARFKTDFPDIIANEQDLFDLMKSQLKNEEIKASDKTILDSYGLDWREATDDEKEYIKKLIKGEAHLVNAWRVVNRKTEKAFQDYCEKEKLTEKKGISHLFHGSRAENFWSIISNGLTINPVGVVITGKAYGNGTYFAPNARKSLGYTSFQGSKWAGGTMSTGFMGIYKVATGKRYNGSGGCNSSLNWNMLQKICPGAHCTWAEARWSGFMMDEVIVYQDCQSTIEYLIEVNRG